MGSVSAMRSIQRVMDKHSADLIERSEAWLPNDLPEGVEVKAFVRMSDGCYDIEVTWKVTLADGQSFELDGPKWDIDQLAGMYPDCDIGY